MNSKFRAPLGLLLLGMAITFIGGLLKIMHCPFANILLGIGLLSEANGLIMLIVNSMKKINDDKK